MTEMGGGPVIIGYDGSPAAIQALKEAAALLAPRRAFVVVVWEPGVAYELMGPSIPPAPIDVRAVLEVDEAMYERAQQLAEHGAELARKADLDAEGLAVADEITVAATLVRLAQERHGSALVVGAHGHAGVGEFLLGSTSREVLRHAPCPVVVVRQREDRRS
jgi:nucleotide-binding universal stress UspA family protein